MLIKRVVTNFLLAACSACASTDHHGYFHGITPDQVSVRYCPGDGITLLCKWGN